MRLHLRVFSILSSRGQLSVNGVPNSATTGTNLAVISSCQAASFCSSPLFRSGCEPNGSRVAVEPSQEHLFSPLLARFSSVPCRRRARSVRTRPNKASRSGEMTPPPKTSNPSRCESGETRRRQKNTPEDLAVKQQHILFLPVLYTI